ERPRISALTRLIDPCASTTREGFVTGKRLRPVVLGIGLLVAMTMMWSGDIRVNAQQPNQSEDAAVKLAGRKIRIDKSTGRLRELSQQEARELVSTLTAMTSRTESVAAVTPGGSPLLQMNGFDHVLVARPNEDGTNDVRCVGSVDDAVSFFSQQ